MISARRPDPITRREFPLQNAGVTRREIYRQRLLRDRPSIARQLFIDRDEIPTGVARTANDREDTLFDLSFAPLPPEFNLETNNSNLPAIPAGAESEEEETGSDGSHIDRRIHNNFQFGQPNGRNSIRITPCLGTKWGYKEESRGIESTDPNFPVA